jgi:hypothetical protein
MRPWLTALWLVACGASGSSPDVPRESPAAPAESAEPAAPEPTASARTPTATSASATASSAAPCDPSDPPGRILTIACGKEEPEQACSERAKREIPPGTRWLATMPGNASAGVVAEVSVDGVAETWSEPNESAVALRAQSLAAQGRKVTLLRSDRVPVPGAREMRVLVVDVEPASRCAGAVSKPR